MKSEEKNLVRAGPASRLTPHASRVSIIAAMARNRVIGAGNKIPWHLPGELKMFKTITMGHPIIMGRKTWESIGKPLPARQNVVVSRQAGLRLDGAVMAHSLDQALSVADRPDPVFVIGGEALFRSALSLASILYLTEIERAFDGDVRFPAFDRTEWREVARDVHEPAAAGGFAYHFATYERAPS